MFDMLDLRQGPPCDWIGLEQFANWATDHLITKVATIAIHADVDYYHIEQYGEQDPLVRCQHVWKCSAASRIGVAFVFFALSLRTGLTEYVDRRK